MDKYKVLNNQYNSICQNFLVNDLQERIFDITLHYYYWKNQILRAIKRIKNSLFSILINGIEEDINQRLYQQSSQHLH